MIGPFRTSFLCPEASFTVRPAIWPNSAKPLAALPPTPSIHYYLARSSSHDMDFSFMRSPCYVCYILIIDAASRFTWVFPLKLKAFFQNLVGCFSSSSWPPWCHPSYHSLWPGQRPDPKRRTLRHGICFHDRVHPIGSVVRIVAFISVKLPWAWPFSISSTYWCWPTPGRLYRH